MKLIQTYPQNNAKNICIDTEIALFFDVKPTLNNSGLLRVYDYQTDELIDCLDLSIPNGPVEPRKIRQPIICIRFINTVVVK